MAQYVRDELPHPQKLKIRKHVASCAVCQRRAHKISEAQQDSVAIDYEAAIQRAAEGAFKWLNALGEEGRYAMRLLPEVTQGSPVERFQKILDDPRFQTVKVCQLLQKECRAAWFEEPARAIELAETAVVVGEHLSESRYGSGLVADTRALAWMVLGNSYRIVDDLNRAERALQMAAQHQELSGDPLTESEILHTQSSLRRSQRRLEEACLLVDRVLDISREGEDRHREGHALLTKGTVLADKALEGSCGFRESIRLLRKGLRRIDQHAEPNLMLAARYNIMYLLIENEPLQAQRMFAQEEHVIRLFGKGVHLAMLPWLEGGLEDALGRLDKSQAALRKSRELLLDMGRPVDSATVSLRLGLVLAKQSRRTEAQELMEEIIPVFEQVAFHREATAAKLLYLRLH